MTNDPAKKEELSKLPEASPPEEAGSLIVGKPAQKAGGPEAVLSTLKHLRRETGLIRGTKTLLRTNQQEGFDCPGCAWPEAMVGRGKIEFCENGAKAIAEEATLQKVDGSFFSSRTLHELSLQTDYWLGKRGRITQPLFKAADSKTYVPISWTGAFQKISQRLNSLSTPNQAVFYTSGRTSNEAAFLYQLFVRSFGTNNLPDCSNLCHESSGVALKETIGIGKGTVRLEDFESAQLILVIGQNPGTNHPRMLIALQKAVRNGAKIVSINPLKEAGLCAFAHPQEPGGLLGFPTALAKLHLPVCINGDVALFKGLIKEVLEIERENSVLDWDFIQNHTLGFEELRNNIDRTDWQEILENCGISRPLLKETARLFIESERTIACWAMGLTQHENAVATIQELVNLMLLKGQIGKEGAGLCPVRGHSNVQGDRTMGIWERPPSDFLDRLEKEFCIRTPREPGTNTVESIEAMLEGKVRVFFAMGGNFLQAGPDTERTALGLRNCDLTVQVSTKLNRSHLITGKEALILPCLGRTERDGENPPRFVSVENSMGIVHSSQGKLPPTSPDLLSEVEIVGRLAQETLVGKNSIPWEDLSQNYGKIRDHISRVIPGFEDFSSRILKPGGFELPNPPRDSRTFPTHSGKANFSVHPVKPIQLERGEFLMMTIRSHDQFNTTIYGLDDRYRGIYGDRRVVFMNSEDMQERGLKAKNMVNLVSGHESSLRKVRNFRVVPYEIPRRCIATYFPETNPLIPLEKVAVKSYTPASKSVICRLEIPS